MNKKNLFLNILKFIPFVIGILLFSLEIVNLFSSLFLFIGGYIAVKNLLDYRIVRKNINNIFENKSNGVTFNKSISNDNVKEISNNNFEYKKNYKSKIKVRKRIR